MGSVITLSVIGLLTGVLFSMPVWGPVSIFIATNGLRGRWRFCVSAAMGSAIVDSLVCFIALQSFVKLMGILSAVIPYLFLGGAGVLFFVGVRIIKTKIDLERSGDAIKNRAILRKKNGFWAGLLLNASNPSIFFGWITSSFLVISFAASLGADVGGFDRAIVVSMHTLKNYSMHPHSADHEARPAAASKKSPAEPILEGKKRLTGPLLLLAGAGYAFSVGLGTVLWFSSFSYVLSRFRTRFPTRVLKRAIQGLGFGLCVLALYFLARGVMALFAV